MAVAEWGLVFLAVYLGAGAVFAVPFVVRGAGRIDPAARGASIGFRLIILPGVVALWPWLAARWLSGSERPPAERSAHRDAAAAVAPRGAP